MAVVITERRANHIVEREFSAVGWTGREAPVVAEGELRDGNHAEPARLDSESALMAQCRRWIKRCTPPRTRTQSNASRRAAGRARLSIWLPMEYLAKLDALCVDSGYARSELLLCMIDDATDQMAETQTTKAPPAARARGAKR